MRRSRRARMILSVFPSPRPSRSRFAYSVPSVPRARTRSRGLSVDFDACTQLIRPSTCSLTSVSLLCCLTVMLERVEFFLAPRNLDVRIKYFAIYVIEWARGNSAHHNTLRQRIGTAAFRSPSRRMGAGRCRSMRVSPSADWECEISHSLPSNGHG